MLARSARAAALVTLSLAALGASACVRGRNDGGRDAAGGASNGAGPAPQPGAEAGRSTDTTMIAPASSAPAAGVAGSVPAGTSPTAGNMAVPGQPSPKR